MNQNFLFDKNVYTKLFVAMVKGDTLIAPYLFYLQERARIKYNFQAIIGEQGSGKSYWAIFESLVLDPTFNIDRIIFSSINFLDALDMLEDRSLKGRNILWDDAGVGLPSDEWYSISNKVIRLIQQTVRTLHPTIKFTMPDMKYIDASQRRVVTSIIDCSRKSGNVTTLRIYTKKRIRIMDKSYHRKFVFKIGAMKLTYGIIRVRHFPEAELPDIMKEYEIVQRKFKFETRKKLKSLLETLREKKLTTGAIDDYSVVTLSDLEKKLVVEIYNIIFNDPIKYMNNKRRIDEDKLMVEFKISSKVSKIIARYFKRKLAPEQVLEDLNLKSLVKVKI